MSKKYWPCEHIDRELSGGPWIYDGENPVPSHWICCPDCKADRPPSDAEIDLHKILLSNDRFRDIPYDAYVAKLMDWRDRWEGK